MLLELGQSLSMCRLCKVSSTSLFCSALSISICLEHLTCSSVALLFRAFASLSMLSTLIDGAFKQRATAIPPFKSYRRNVVVVEIPPSMFSSWIWSFDPAISHQLVVFHAEQWTIETHTRFIPVRADKFPFCPFPPDCGRLMALAVMLDLPRTRACAEVKAPVKYYIRSWNWYL